MNDFVFSDAYVAALTKQPYRLEVWLEIDADGTRFYVARHPEMEGCEAQGSTPDEAIASLRLATDGAIRALLRAKVAVPAPDIVTVSDPTDSSRPVMDLHLVFDSDEQQGKVFDSRGTLLRLMSMRDTAVAEGFSHWGRCPRGRYRLARPVAVCEPAMGRYFTPLLGVPGRQGIGIHGGGSGLAEPFAPRQGWVPTHGCLRLQNQDNEWLAERIEGESVNGLADAWITVQGT